MCKLRNYFLQKSKTFQSFLIILSLVIITGCQLDQTPPVADASLSSNLQGHAPLVVSFNGMASSDNRGIAIYEWTFGDGQVGIGPILNHTYHQPGEYTAVLTVIDGAGLVDTDLVTVVVSEIEEPENQPPVADLSLTMNIQGEAPLTVSFNGSASTDDTQISNFLWEFGDGLWNSSPVIDHTYNQPGLYTATLTVTDDQGLTHSSSISIEVISSDDGGDDGSDGPDTGSELSCSSDQGTIFEVGPAHLYANIGDVPFDQLNPGDQVKIHWRELPYKEKILVSRSGSAEMPICISGVKGPSGQLPVIDGNGATTSPSMETNWLGTQTRGTFIVAQKPGDQWGYKPSNIVVENLELRGAYEQYHFTDSQGNSQSYTNNAAAVFVERGENITFRGLTITDSGNGFFVASGGEEEMLSKNITLEHSYIYGNGTNSYRHHNLYTEALGMVIQFNRFGPLRDGAQGDNIKDRSTGTIIRYNWVEGSRAQLLDLVEAEDTWTLVNNNPEYLSRYRKTYVYGNTLINTQSRNTVHYGGDNGATETYRKGMLHFYNNTVIFDDRTTSRWAGTLFRLETQDETVDARNNIIYHFGGTALVTLMNVAGQAYFQNNIINQAYENWYNRTDETADGSIHGLENVLVSNQPFFVDVDNYDFSLIEGSDAIDTAIPLHSDVMNLYPLSKEYVLHQRQKEKQIVNAADMGAFEKVQ